jgi:hypothetical protein
MALTLPGCSIVVLAVPFAEIFGNDDTVLHAGALCDNPFNNLEEF